MGCRICSPEGKEPQLKFSRIYTKNGVKVKKSEDEIKEDFNNFISLFENNLKYIGNYISQQDFNSCIPEKVQSHMIEHPFDIKEKYNVDTETYELKPVEFKNGNIYQGNWNDDLKMEGLGKYYLKDQNVLAEGVWSNGDLLYARVFLQNDDIYEGEMKNSTFNGKGKLISANGDIYEGDFVDGKTNGNGKLVFGDKTVYEGQFEKGEFKGNGHMKWTSGYDYEGNFDGAKLCGFGVLTHPCGDKYEGNFENSLFHGNGKYIYENGDIYEGEFQYGLKKGKGIYNASHKFEYNGDWDNDLPCGFGKVTNWNKKGLLKSTWRNGKIIEEPTFEQGTKSDFKSIDLNIVPEEMKLDTKDLTHLESFDGNSSQYKIGSLPSFLED